MSGRGAPKHKVKRLARNVLAVYLEFDSEQKEHWVLLRSDAHHDSIKCDRKMEKRHLDQALERGAGILDNGDLFDAMQARYDDRSDQDNLRPEYRGEDYWNRLLAEAVEFYGPYAENILELDHGNHETSAIKHCNFDLTSALAGALNIRHGTNIQCGGFSGWMFFRLRRGRQSKTIRLFRHHGYGGAAPVTKGVIQTARMSPWLPDAHMVVTGHNHAEWIMPIVRMRVSEAGRVYHDEQLHIRVPGYKDGTGDGFGGWENVKGFAPLPKGAIWLRFFLRYEGKHAMHFEYEALRAK